MNGINLVGMVNVVGMVKGNPHRRTAIAHASIRAIKKLETR